MTEQHLTKRRKKESPGEEKQTPSLCNWAAFIPIDSVDPVMCNLQTMEYARPALYIQAVRDTPVNYTPDGIPAHRTGFTRAQLAAFVSSFYVQRLMVTKQVSLDELVGVFTQQGVAFACSGLLPSEDTTVPSGVSASRLSSTASASVREACDVLARGLCYWNRLELCMDASLGSHLRPLPASIQLGHFAGFDCSATRAWIRFNHKPRDASTIYSARTCKSLVSDWPFWLDRFMHYLGSVYVEHKLSGYTETTFLKMTEAAHNCTLGTIWWLARDGPSPHRNEAARFSGLMRATLQDNAYTVSAPHQATLPGFHSRQRIETDTEGVHFAKACVAFCLETVTEATDYGALFSGSCANDNGQTPERTAFSKALARMGVRVLRWSDDPDTPRRAITFP
eukprot:926942-Prymnesium_polylepis.1